MDGGRNRERKGWRGRSDRQREGWVECVRVVIIHLRSRRPGVGR